MLPEIPALRLEVDEHHHHKDVYEHSPHGARPGDRLRESRAASSTPPTSSCASRRCCTTSASPRRAGSSPAARCRFHHHDVVGAKLARKRLRALRFDNDTIAAVSRLIELHLRFFGYADGAWTDSAVRRYVRDAGDQLERLHILTRADVTTRNRRKADRLGFAYDDLEERIAVLAEEEELAAVRPELDGAADHGAARREARARSSARPTATCSRCGSTRGRIGPDAAAERLRAWWAARDA